MSGSVMNDERECENVWKCVDECDDKWECKDEWEADEG